MLWFCALHGTPHPVTWGLLLWHQGVGGRCECGELPSLWFRCFLDDSVDVGNLISGSSALSKTNFSIWKFMIHILLKPGLESFEHYFTSM